MSYKLKMLLFCSIFLMGSVFAATRITLDFRAPIPEGSNTRWKIFPANKSDTDPSAVSGVIADGEQNFSITTEEIISILGGQEEAFQMLNFVVLTGGEDSGQPPVCKFQAELLINQEDFTLTVWTVNVNQENWLATEHDDTLDFVDMSTSEAGSVDGSFCIVSRSH